MDAGMETFVQALNEGAHRMRHGSTVAERLEGAARVTNVGMELIAERGFEGLQEAYRLVDGEHQQTVEVEWFGLTDGEKRWLR